MPLGFERINERITRPNALINFIKPLPGPNFNTAQDFLSRIAAQCYPIMKANHIAVMALEEYEWNTEFIGRNFNAGEVIQLVLRSRSGQWLPFKHVQMVMMHELAHCKEMNHSRDFWKVRNGYAEEMRGLWSKKYMGEGLWGKGVSLESGRFLDVGMPNQSEMPEHMCGGTYRRRGRKRKRSGPESGKSQLSYAEKKQRRILKKFGAGGVALGNDEETRIKLEDGKKPKGKPRVAGSNRGRELRAAAALARFEKFKEEPVKKEDDTDSDTEDEFDWPPTDDEVDIKREGKNFVRVCEAEDEDDADVKREMEELYDLSSIPEASAAKKTKATDSQFKPPSSYANKKSKPALQLEQPSPWPNVLRRPQSIVEPPVDLSDTESGPDLKSNSSGNKRSTVINSRPRLLLSKSTPSNANAPTVPLDDLSDTESEDNAKVQNKANHTYRSRSAPKKGRSIMCVACSMTNEFSALMCATCSNVLDPARTPNHWRCHSEACRAGVYVNMGDYGSCQVCGTSKP